MAKLTGQFTTPRFDANNNKTHEAFLHAVVFVFTSGATKVTRETDAKGKYSFDLANGEYEVSVYLKGNTEKDRFDMRAGEKFVVTATTKEDALEKWLQVIGNNGKDELATYYENLFNQMNILADDVKRIQKEMLENVVGTGPEYMLRSAYGVGSTSGATVAEGTSLENIPPNGFYRIGSRSAIAPSYNQSGDSALVTAYSKNLFSILYFGADKYRYSIYSKGLYSAGRWTELLTDFNTTVDSNGFIKKASPIIKLFDDRIESNDQFLEEAKFEKIGVGTYKISNTKGLAKDGWTYEKPRGNDGQPYFRIVVEKLEDGCIVRVHDEYDTVEKAEITDIDGNTRIVDKIVKILGQARDIKEHERWIDLRFHEEQEADDEELLTQLDNLNESAH